MLIWSETKLVACEIPHLDLVALVPIARGEEIVLQISGEQESLGYMLQFDGSHHKD